MAGENGKAMKLSVFTEQGDALWEDGKMSINR